MNVRITLCASRDLLSFQDTSNVSKKPLLVELHSFPGYDDVELTPLPASLTAEFMLKVVVDAQKYLKNKVR